MDWYKILEQFGLGTALAVGVFLAFFFLLKWVLETSKELLVQMAEERKAWTVCLNSLTSQFQSMSVTNKAFYDQVNDAHKYQREEHKEMIESLGRINGYKH